MRKIIDFSLYKPLSEKETFVKVIMDRGSKNEK